MGVSDGNEGVGVGSGDGGGRGGGGAPEVVPNNQTSSRRRDAPHQGDEDNDRSTLIH